MLQSTSSLKREIRPGTDLRIDYGPHGIPPQKAAATLEAIASNVSFRRKKPV